ncbi:MAG: hypothetical protein V1907_04680 [Candidatus Kerfeldbacteria bacterium]
MRGPPKVPLYLLLVLVCAALVCCTPAATASQAGTDQATSFTMNANPLMTNTVPEVAATTTVTGLEIVWPETSWLAPVAAITWGNSSSTTDIIRTMTCAESPMSGDAYAIVWYRDDGTKNTDAAAYSRDGTKARHLKFA